MLHYFGITLLFAGAVLEQYATTKSVTDKKGKDCSSSKANLLLVLATGLFCEWMSLMMLPLCTYVLLSSCHYFIKLLFEVRVFSFAEKAEGILLILSYLLVSVWGGQQGEFSRILLNRAIDVNYYMWMMGSLAFNMTVRKMGFYANRPIFESFIPAQISTFGLGGLKMMHYCLQLFIYGEPLDFPLFLTGFVVCVLGFAISSSFLKMLNRLYEGSLVLGTYYLWNICYSVPLALWVMDVGVPYTSKEYFAIALAFLMIAAAMSHRIYDRYQAKPPVEKEEKESAGTEMQGIELNIDDETEVIDEELLLVNIKNV